MVRKRKPTSPEVLVTGANGFIGRALCSHLHRTGIGVVGAIRRRTTGQGHWLQVGDVHGHTDWSHALAGVQTVVHLAGKSAAGRRTEEILQQVNVEGAANLARQAARAGVKRLVYLSSLKVLGESSHMPFTNDQSPNPASPYGRSKHEAEKAMTAVSRQTGLELVILRPPLVYGRGVAGNFGRLVRLAASGLPLPLASIENKRSLISVGNLCELIRLCLHHPSAPGQFLLAADGAISTPALIRLMARCLGKPAHLLPFPVFALRLLGQLSGKSDLISRLVDSLEVDDDYTRQLLGWEPGRTLEQELLRCLS